jgi:ABC-type multidrug transport system ATPase subunit
MAPDLVISNLRNAFVGPVSLTLVGGTITTLAGSSGAGKTLFLRMIADLDPNDGEVRLGTLDRAATPAPEWRGRVTYVAAEAGWWAPTIAAHWPPAASSRADAIGLALGLDRTTFERPPASFSTGERQRLALIRALVRDPDVLLLDEPTSALDVASAARVETLLDEIRTTGTSILLVSHDPDQARRLGRDHYVMDGGRLSRA